jgi:1-acyl-sn-glycerol-3-phosphate acyltransferase
MDLYRFFKTFVIKPFLRVRYRVKVVGKRQLPKVNSAIIAANHLAKADSLIIAAFIKNKLIFGAKKEYFAGKTVVGKVTKWFMHAVDQIPVDRSGRGVVLFFKDATKFIRNRQGWFGIHFEGTRSPDGRLYKARIGVAKIALATHVPVIPTAIIGTDSERKRWWHRIPVTVIHGAPIHYDEYKDMTPAALADLIGRRVHELGGQEYVDEHAPIVNRDTLQ